MKRTQFSIIIPALNEEKFLPRLLESLSIQTRKNFEVIVVDGNSKDKTVAVCRAYEKRVPLLHVEVVKRPSLPAQRNLGASIAKGDWLVFVDADSVLLPNFIQRAQTCIDETNPMAFTTWFTPDSSLGKDAMFILIMILLLESSLVFLHKTFPPGPLALIRRDVFETIGGYDETHKYHEDIDLGLRFAKARVPLSILRETLYVWSLRRYRREGTLKVLQQSAFSLLPAIIFGKAIKSLPSYVMGGQLYGKKKRIAPSVLKIYERKLRKLMKELFA